MGASSHQQTFPRGALVGAACLLALAMALAALGRFGGIGRVEVEESALVSRTELRFYDLERGGVGVSTAADGEVTHVLEPGEDGFVRSVMRGFARDRRQHGVGASPPFLLSLWANGRLSLADPKTGREISLNAFGPANIRAFARFLPAGRPGQPNQTSTAQR